MTGFFRYTRKPRNRFISRKRPRRLIPPDANSVPVNHVQAYNFRPKENLAIYITARLILVLKIRTFSQYNAIQII